jgi:uncharacterized membrane protein
MITNGHLVPAGTSGAISWLGTLTALAGGAFIGIAALVGGYIALGLNQSLLLSLGIPLPLFVSAWWIVLGASISGLAGALFDSFLGATAQAVYFSEYDERQTEKRFDSQGKPTRLVRGWRWLDNDWVNFFASIFGSLVAALMAFFL